LGRHILPRHSNPFLLLAGTLFAYNFSLGITRSTQNNFWVEVLKLQPNQVGILIAAREAPGFLMIAIAALTMRLAPARVATASFVLMAVGYVSYGFATSLGTLIPGVVVAYVGFHTWLMLSSAFILAVTGQDTVGRVQGELRAVGFVAMLLGTTGVFFSIDSLGYQAGFAISGLAMLVGAVLIARFPNEIVHRSPPRTIVRRKYLIFYLLNFFQGCRFELFQAVGLFLLVHYYHLPVQTIAALFVVTSALGVVLSPLVGRWIDRFGERTVLSIGYAGMFLTFLGFASWHNATAATALYIVYNALVTPEMAVNTYLKKVASSADIRPTLATSLTITHIPALTVPIVGGELWTRYGFEIPFLLGAGFILCSLIAARRIPSHAVTLLPIKSV
jgi:Major Facilitator Superfamily